MQQTKENIAPLQSLLETIELLDQSSQKLIEVMEEQVDAIIGSDTEKIESLSDRHATLTWQYKGYEKKFISELSSALNSGKSEDGHQGLRLLNLKLKFPESEEQIDKWHKMLTSNASKLQSKHQQVMELLEFAMEQNARLMHSMYSQHSEKDSHYGANGNRSAISTGIAVNQEV